MIFHVSGYVSDQVSDCNLLRLLNWVWTVRRVYYLATYNHYISRKCGPKFLWNLWWPQLAGIKTYYLILKTT